MAQGREAACLSLLAVCRCVPVRVDTSVQISADICCSQRGETKLSAEVCSLLRNCVLQAKKEKGLGGGRDREGEGGERERKVVRQRAKGRKRGVGGVIIEAGVDCSSMADECHTPDRG